MLHFHERDLAISMICFNSQFISTDEEFETYKSTDYSHVTRLLEEAVGFHHHSFKKRIDAGLGVFTSN